ncbi:LysM peptidoglycan-binding domain-containing protein [Cellulomonas chengniuliangii]|uniref:LysM peptidoglycan-binding domain-containing protein n=1 Tax=Cellulomonas chengniuliangii TaxID=2968084 RepID=A0ABY5KV99_9CELL|nr:LysM peptidoglycan-binding domain-containing protein [Cellulomonas chengniuliangii]MCC2309140.1 LysM peptidoglycan-binding domain-containing protein [Cellulomonas chengniuliangii]UUI74144.1 LysM peptidoglycan-binding domain-containing protein [Cellulomonas chengniuliangii]
MSTMVIGSVARQGDAVVIPCPARRPSPAAGRGTARPARPVEPTLQLTPRGRRVVAMLSLMLVTAFGLIGTKAVAGAPARALEVQAYTVAAGDTYWDLAADLAAPGEDVRDVLLELVDLNGAQGAGLTAGQRILLPVER